MAHLIGTPLDWRGILLECFAYEEKVKLKYICNVCTYGYTALTNFILIHRLVTQSRSTISIYR